MNMMKNLTKTFTLAMAMLAAPFAAEAAGAGNIYAIFPLDQDGNVNPPTTATLAGGDLARFVVRLQKNEMGGNPFRLRHVGLGSEAADWESRRPKIGIYVSGEFRTAELESWAPLANGSGEICYTDFIFSYRVKPGDFELPMRLADKNRKMITDVSDSSEFYFDFLHDAKYAPAWAIDDSAEGGPAGTPANLWFTMDYGTFYDPGDGSYAYVENYDFTQCKYFIQTVDFDGNDETGDFWRTVHEGSTQTGGAQPSLHVDGLPTNSVTLYVWSMDESAVKVVGEKMPIHMTSPTAEPVEIQVATIKVVAGKTDYPFDIEGVTKGRTTQLVLSAFPDFQYGKQGTTTPVRMDDYTTVTVSCTEPLPASVKIAPALTRVTATATSWQNKVTELAVSFSEPFGEDVEVEIVPGFSREGSPLPWADYIRFSAKADEDVTLQAEPVANPKVLIPAGKKVPTQFVGGAAIVDGKIYVYALRADAFSDGATAKLTFAVKTDNEQAQKPSAEGGIDGWGVNQSTLTVVAQDPVIVEPTDGKAYKAFAGNPCTFQIKVSDDWANMTNAYKVSIWKDSTDGAGFTELADEYVPNPKTGVLYKKGTSELPSATYTIQTDPYDTAIKVKSVVSENESEERHVSVTVGAQKGYTIAIADEVSEFDEGTYTQLKITFDEMVSDDCYAFLKPVGEASNVVAECTWLAGDPEAEGQWIRAGETELVFDEFQIMDGDASKAGSAWKFDVVLLKTKEWSDDPEDAYGKFKAKNTVKYNVHNVTPTVTGITPDGKPAKRIKESGATIKGAWPKSDTLKHTFAITVDEPGVWDRTIDKDGKRFETVVTFYNEDEGDAEYYPDEAPEDGVIYGDPETNTCTRIFSSAGRYRCEVMLKDKDMKDYDDDRTFVFYFDVVDNPAITVETEPSYQETDVPEFGGSAKVAVKLAINDCTFPMYLKMKIAPNNDSANPGTFLLETNTTSCVWQGDGTYLVTIPKGKTEVVLPVQQMDGTRDSAITGFQITGELPEELNNTSIVPGSDNQYPFQYYVWSDPEAFKVRNDPPVVETVSPASSTNVYKSAAGLADVTITWSVNDVTPDFERPVQGGVTVTFTGGAEKWETNVTSYADMIAVGETGYTPNFSGKSGRQTVMMTVKDHDGGTADSFTWEFEIESSKSLELSAHGPSTGFGGNNGDRYTSRAKGIGAGRVWAKSDSEIGVTFFNSTVNCGLAGATTLYAYGYKTGDVDGGDARVLHYPNWKQQADGTWARDGGYYDGTGALPARDTPINAGGNRYQPGETPYAYAGRTDAYGREVDSFLYAWLVFGGGGADAGETASADELLDARIMPEQSELSDGGHRLTLPGEKDESGNFAKTLAEAVFAIEKFWSDNMGDINLDGVPDVYAKLYGFGVFDQAGMVTGDDLVDLAAFNDDEDYLPGTGDSAYAAFIPGLASDWSAEGRKFGAALEIRGYGDHLNDATEIEDVVGVKPDRIYCWTDADGNRIWSPSNCTLSELEFRSWVSAGCDPKWSPERPTDPTLADTDKDGLPDGYEYFFWYRAFVGDVEYFNAKDTKGKFRRLTGHRYNPLHPETGDEISWQEIAEAFDPRSDKSSGGAMSPEQMARRDFDGDGLPDLLEFELGTNPIEWDTDGDGLPDGWEVMHGFDPCKQKTDGQTADGAANPDGDYMAVATVPLTVIESYDKDGRPVYFATTRALTEDDVTCDTSAPEAGWRVKIGGACYFIPGDKEKEAEFFTSFVNAAPAPEGGEEEGGEELVENGAGAGLVIGGGDEAKESAEGWYLAKDLLEKEAYSVKPLTEGDETVLVRGTGARLFRGVHLDEAPVYLGSEDAPGGCVLRMLAVTLPATGSAEDFTNRGFTAWRYGAKGISLNDGKNHLFALGASCEVPGGETPVVDIRADESVLILHHQVYQWRGFYLNAPEAKKYGTLTLRKDMGTGFNPTTGWMRDKQTGCVNKRWSGYSTGIFEPMQDCAGIRDMAGFGTAPYPGVAVDTLAFANRDEFLLMDFRFFAGQIAEAAMAPKENETMQHVWARETTLPVNAEDKFGADTDADGVPDGWELYVATGPSPDDSSLTFGTPTFSPLKASDVNTKVEFDWVTKQGWSTSMTLVSKFAGTDTMIAYADVPSVADPKNLFNERWLNKFWPLDPWSFDTDCDGIPDHQEGAVHTDDNAVTGYIYNGTEIAVHNGIYGSPVDDGSKCIPGGGMNPNSWDTDLDGLPDLWEGQHDLSAADLSHHGWYVGGTTGSDTNAVTSGSFQGGMDPTVHDSYTRTDVGIDRDYDHDGLQNWQEYLTGVIRAFRYDDALSPWTVPQWSEATGSDEMLLEALVTGKRLDPLTEGGSNPHLVFGKFDYLAAYGSQCRRPSDYACGYWYFFPDGPNHVLRQGLSSPADGCVYAKEIKAAGQNGKVAQTYGPAMYFTCSPTCADSDADGMDDYYELFHGMDPLYGGDKGRDLIALRWANGYPFNNVSAKNNLWTFTLKARGTSDEAKLYDFAVFPWMAGDPAADPDGDDIRNVDEAIQANAQANETWLHTDPTPLWMTDSSDPNSLVSRYYGGIATSGDPDLKDQYPFAVPATAGDVELPYVAPVAGHRWGVENRWVLPKVQKRFGYAFAFEENDGYDTDHDGLSDAREAHALGMKASDPQDSDDPLRRQAMYFPGAKSALQARSDAVLGLDGHNELMFLEFTVECWVKPEDVSRAQTIVERVIRHPNSNPGDWNLYRRNFQLGIDETGRFFAAYDSNGTGTDRVTATAQGPASPNKWAHLAATYDGQALVLYVNGQVAFAQPEKTHPATAAETVVTTTADGLTTDVGKLASESAVVMGASIAQAAPFFSLVPGQSTWDNYDRFYKGYLDEVRVWDGARDGVSIAEDYKARKRYTKDDLLANREAVFEKWSAGVRRNLTTDVADVSAADLLPPELVYHYTFDGLFGAVEESLVAQEPNGFSATIGAHGKAAAARPAGWVSPGWRDLSVHSLAYHNYAYVPWIPNLVAHLPAFDGTTLDSVYWSEDFAGAEPAGRFGYRKFGFPRTAEPEVNFTPVQQSLGNFDPDSSRQAVVGFDMAFEFAKRARVLYATDLLPLGDAFVKFSTDFWDSTEDVDQGASSITETSGKDDDFDDLPDWWEKLVADGDIGTYSWKSEMTRDGVTRTAGEWFVLDTAKGAHDTTTGGVLADPAFASKADVKGDGIPDWWKSLYGIGDATSDPDFDGLFNGFEYRVFAEKLLPGGAELDPTKNASDGKVLDYYRTTVKWDYTNNCPAAAEAGPALLGMMNPGVTKSGALYPYLGFVLTDHDFIDDTWEDLFGVEYVSKHVFDAPRDKDRDGWSNWSEFLAGTAPDGSARLSLVRADGNEDHALENYPIPTLRAKVSLDNGAAFTQNIVIKAWHGASAVGEPDATWTVAGSGEVSAWSDRFLGLAPNRLVKFNIGPGDIGQSHVKLEFYDPNYWIEEVSSGETKIILHNIDTSDWGVVYFGDDPADDSHGKDTGTMLGGFVNYRNGDIEIDFTNPRLRDTDYTFVESSSKDTKRIYHYDLSRSFWRVSWMSRLTEVGNTKTFSLSKAAEGHLRQGVNTFVAYVSDDKGNYVPGNPLGVARNVDVGWDKVTDLSIALTANPGDVRFMAAGEGNKRVRVERTAVNGVATPARAIWGSKADLSVRNWFTEADYVRSALGEYDLDWKNLVADAALLGIGADEIETADYRLIVGGEPVTTFTRMFSAERQAAQAVEPSGNAYTVRMARPTFRWAGVSGMTAFELQVATDKEFKAEDIVWTSGVRPLPLVENGIRTFKSDCYVGEALEDGKFYWWRVAEMNAKWPTPGAWSVPASFRTEVDSSANMTGYGQLKAHVRYYGVSAAEMDQVVVGVYETADFTGLPVARKRLSKTLGEKASALAYSAPAGKSWMDTVANVTFDGIVPGRYYVMAFIDENGNGQRDVWESWGYVNSIGKKAGSIYAPVEVEVVAGKPTADPALLCLDDTDVNDDHVPDCLQNGEEWENPDYGRPEASKTVDTDGDGLSDYDEEYFYGTDPKNPDTDGDGIPDGIEIRIGLEPLDFDSDASGENDVMAYAEETMHVTEIAGKEYVLVMEEDKTKADYGQVKAVLKTLRYGTNDMLVAWGEADATVTPAMIGGKDVYEEKVILVHNAVYQQYGYEEGCARACRSLANVSSNAVHTVPFTYAWKYFTIELAKYVKPTANVTVDYPTEDNDANGIADGWELYVDQPAGTPDELKVLRAAWEYNFDPEDDYYFYRKAYDAGAFAAYPLMPLPEVLETLPHAFPFGTDWDNAFMVLNKLDNADNETIAAWLDAAPADDVLAVCEKSVKTVTTTEGTFAIVERKVTNRLQPNGQLGTTERIVPVVFKTAVVNEKPAPTVNPLPVAGIGAGDVETRRLVATTPVLPAITDLATAYANVPAVEANVFFMHSAVYDAFGYDPTTAKPEQGEGTNAVAGANTAAFSRYWKYATKYYYLAAQPAVPAGAVAATEFANLGADVTDSNGNQVEDGYELYIRYATDAFKALGQDYANRIGAAYVPPQYSDDLARKSRGVDLGNNPINPPYLYNRVVEAYDPYDPYYLWGYDELADFNLTNDEVNDYNLTDRNTEKDDDMDGLSNFNEWRANTELGVAAGAALDPFNLETLPGTPDYFRLLNGGKYAGEVYNGAEWIESDMRENLIGEAEYAYGDRAGTRDYHETGWDVWSTARYSINNADGTTEISGVSDKITLLIRYFNVMLPGSYQGTGTLKDVGEFFHATWADIMRVHHPDGTYDDVKADDRSAWSIGWSADDVLVDADAAVMAEDMIRFFGGKERMEREIAENRTVDFVTPEPKIGLTLRYAGQGAKTVIVEAYQYDRSYGEQGVQSTAKWGVAANFENGLAKAELKTPSEGKLVQGEALFVAYIGDDANSSTVYGVAEANVGYAGADITITLGDQNPALPKIDVSSISNATEGCRLAIVRSEINGQPLGENVAAVYVRGLENNLQRETLYPTEWVSANYIGVDRYFDEAEGIAKAMGMDHVHSVTYDVLVGCGMWDKSTYLTNAVQRFTVNYEGARSIPKNLRFTTATEGDVTFSFDLPEGDYPYTKFWMTVEDVATAVTTTHGGALGFILPNAAGKAVTIDPADYGINLAAGQYRVAFAIGNDKFGEPAAADYSSALELNVNDARAYAGGFSVTVKHPTANLAGGKMTVAAYETEDLANPVAFATGADCANPIPLGNLRAGKKYYLAAWYVVDDADGRRDATVRAPYDTWGYLCAFDQASACFTPLAVEATDVAGGEPVTIWLQDTDWDDNGRIDRTEAITYPYQQPGGLDPVDPFWPVGPEPTPWDPVFPPEEDETRWANGDVMAYADIENVLLVKVGADRANAEWHAVMDLDGEGVKLRDSGIALQTDASAITSLATIWNMAAGSKSGEAVKDDAALVGVGRRVAFPAGVAKVWDTRTATVRLVHAQVYAQFGFETGCAAVCADNVDPRLEDGIAKAEHPHTKSFTHFDKYLVVRYFEAIGVAGVSEAAALLNPADPIWSVYMNDCVEWWADRAHADSDRDDVGDGWELYTMYGKTDLKAFMSATLGALTAAKISPYNAADGLLPAPGDAAMDADKQLTLVQEFDGGYYSTDPWSVDTPANGEKAGDGVIDYYAYAYHLKGEDAGKDFDLDEDGNWVGDGLANYAEYLVSEVFKYAKLDPDKVKTDGFCVDYFRKMGELYLGEIFTDHDQVDDQWEAQYASAANRYAYDPSRDDVDRDGWSNFEEYSAGTDPTRETQNGVQNMTKVEYPVPVIEARVVYNGKDANLGTMVFKAWNEKRDADMLAIPDAIWTVARGGDDVEPRAYEKYLGRKPSGVKRYVLQGGEVTEGSVKLNFLDTGYATCVVDGNGNVIDVKPGEPDKAQWYYQVHDEGGKLVLNGNVLEEAETEVGTIDYKTGLMTVNFDMFSGKLFGDSATNSVTGANHTGLLNNSYDLLDLDNSYVKVTWEAKNTGVSANGMYYLTDADPVTAEAKSKGHVCSGLSTFLCYSDEDGDGAYTPGEPFGVVRGVDVGWQGAKFTVELTETHATTPRIALWGDTDDRSTTVDDINRQLLNNELNHISETNIEDFINARIDTSKPPAAGKTAHIRVVRYAIDDMFCYNAGVGSEKDGYDQIVVLDKTFDPSGRDYLCEADFLVDGQFDIDWNTLTGTDFRKGAIVDKDGKALGGDRGPAGAGLGVTNMSYLVVIGDGPKDFGFKYDTNTVRALATVVTRRFEKTRSQPVVDATHKTFTSARPTFTWSMPNEEDWAKKFGSSYTAFRLQILEDEDPGQVVYDSGIVRAPKTEGDAFVWTAPLCAGSVTPQGKIFSANATYKWHVTMYNAKFRSDYWSSTVTSGPKPYGQFTMSVNGQQDVNDHDSSLVNVTVKYAGPSDVLAKSADLAELKGKVRVQAFATADFSGEPLAEAVVTDEIADVTVTTANAKLLGLPVGATYYVRAYIDMNGNCRKDDWESWGYLKTPVELKTSDRTAQTVGLYIEDADTDQDWLPDAWEYAYAGWTGDFSEIKNDLNTMPAKSRVIAVSEALATALANDKLAASISSGLPGVTLTTLQSPDFAEVLLGLDKTSSIDAIRAAVEKKVAPDSVKITSMTLAEDKIVLTVDADVAYEIAGMPLNLVYDLMAYANVTLRIWKKDTLLDANWTKVGGDVSVSFNKGVEKVEVDVSGKNIDFSSGFYKVEVVQ